MAGNDKKSKNFLVSKIGGQQLIVLGVIVALFAFFCIKSDIFRSYSTILSMLDFSYFVAFMAIGVTFALITGGNDLSIGTGMVCYGIIGGFFVTKLGLPVTVGFVITILCGILMGCLNGFLVAILELPPFIATLSTMMIARGLGSIVTGGSSITWPADAWFKNLFKITVGESRYPLGFIWVVAAVTIMTVFLRHTKPGRYIIAIGSNKEATRLSGVNVIKWHMLAYIICGMFTGFAGVAYSATFPTIAAGSGAGLELEAICAAIIGGTSMYGGSGTIFGTLLGVYVMSILNEMTEAKIMGVLITKVDERKNYYKQTREILGSYENIHVFDSFIHVDSSIEWAQDASQPVAVYKKSTRSAKEFESLAKEVMEYGSR